MKYIYFIIPSVILGIILGVILGIIYTKRNTKTNPLPKNCEFVDILPDKSTETDRVIPMVHRSIIKAIIKENINDAKEYSYDPRTGKVYDLKFNTSPIGKVYFVNGEAKKYDNIYIINELYELNKFYKTEPGYVIEPKSLIS
jgi:hypothetical protein